MQLFELYRREKKSRWAARAKVIKITTIFENKRRFCFRGTICLNLLFEFSFTSLTLEFFPKSQKLVHSVCTFVPALEKGVIYQQTFFSRNAGGDGGGRLERSREL